jgi:hypothetical protein
MYVAAVVVQAGLSVVFSVRVRLLLALNVASVGSFTYVPLGAITGVQPFCDTASVKVCVALLPTPLAAVKVNG